MLPRRSKLYIACSDFLCKNQSSLMPLLLLFRKRSHSRRLFGCKRPHNAFGSLPTFCEAAPASQISQWFAFPTKAEPKRYNVNLVSNREGLRDFRKPFFVLDSQRYMLLFCRIRTATEAKTAKNIRFILTDLNL